MGDRPIEHLPHGSLQFFPVLGSTCPGPHRPDGEHAPSGDTNAHGSGREQEPEVAS